MQKLHGLKADTIRLTCLQLFHRLRAAHFQNVALAAAPRTVVLKFASVSLIPMASTRNGIWERFQRITAQKLRSLA
eukprot:7030354-Pyramimonas_sp.AAC.1